MFSKLLPKLRSASVCAISLLTAASLAQTTINVGPGQPYTTIQLGINAAMNGDTVLVAPGTYYENINFNGKAITVTSSGGAANTIIDGGTTPGAATVTMDSGTTQASIISNFTIRNGGQNPGYGNFSEGGGIYVGGSAATILNNVITANSCSDVQIAFGAAIIKNNEINGALNNNPDYCGYPATGIAIQGNAAVGGLTQTEIIGNVIENNLHGEFDGALSLQGSNLIVMNNIIRNNVEGEGAITSDGAINLVFVQNLVYGNTATGTSQVPQGAGGLTFFLPSDVLQPYSMVFANNVFFNNTVQGPYAATQMYFDGNDSGILLENNIIFGSGSLPAFECSSAYAGGTPLVSSHNDIFNPIGIASSGICNGLSASNGNLSTDPIFNNAAAGDFHVRSGSPVIDTGSNNIVATLASSGVTLPTDFSDTPRIQNSTGTPCAIIDMGAYEYPGLLNDCTTTETLTSSLNPSTYGQSVTFTAQLSSANGVPTGDVQFADGSTFLGTEIISSTGASTFTTSLLTIGSHTITATYQPTGVFPAANATLTQVINGEATATNLTCTPASIPLYNTAFLTATVTSASSIPTGSIAFTDNGAALATKALLSGATNLTYTGLIAGVHTLTATYIPTGSFAASLATCSETVTALPSTSVLTVNPISSTYGSPVTLTANVSPATPPGPSTPAGTVTFYNGAAAIGTGTLVSGVATLTLSNLPGPSDNLTCTYGGNSIYATSNCNTVPVVINAAASTLTLSSSNNPAPALSPITFTAHLMSNGQSAGAGNSISLNLNGQSIVLTTDATGSASYTVSTLIPGSYPVTANFAATSSLLANSASLTEVVTAVSTTTGLTVTPNPAYFSQLVTMTATVSSQTTATQVNNGSVTFFDGATALGTQPVNANGIASFTISTFAVGTHPITATYNPANTSFVTSTSPVVNEVILASGFTIALLPRTITLPHGASGTVAIQLASVGNFAGPLALTYGILPTDATASISPATVTLTAGGTGSSTLTLNTLLKASNAVPTKPGSRGLPVVFTAFTLLLVPLSFAKRRKLVRLLGLVVLAFALQAITGCTNAWYTATVVAPGTYQLPVTATDSNHNSQTATLTVTVTP